MTAPITRTPDALAILVTHDPAAPITRWRLTGPPTPEAHGTLRRHISDVVHTAERRGVPLADVVAATDLPTERTAP